MMKFDYNINDNIIELLSSALYDYPVYALREYLQNSYDSLREENGGEIYIVTDETTRTVKIYDNGKEYTNVEEFENNFRNFATSNKGDTELFIGHKGIGIIAFMSKSERLVFNAKIDGNTEIIVYNYSTTDKKLTVTRDTKIGTELFDEKGATFVVQIEGLEKKSYENINYMNYAKNRIYRLSHILPLPYQDFDKNRLLQLNEGIRIYLNEDPLQKESANLVFGSEITEFKFLNINNKVIAQGAISYLGGNIIDKDNYSNKTNRKKLACGLSIRKKGMFISDGSKLQKKIDDGVSSAFYVELNIENNFLIENTARTWFESSEDLDYFESLIEELYVNLDIIRNEQSRLYNDKISYDKYKEAVLAAKNEYIKIIGSKENTLVKIVPRYNVITNNDEEGTKKLNEKLEKFQKEGLGVFSGEQINFFDELDISGGQKENIEFIVSDEDRDIFQVDTQGNLIVKNKTRFNENKKYQISFRFKDEYVNKFNLSKDEIKVELRNISKIMEDKSRSQFYIDLRDVEFDGSLAYTKKIKLYKNFLNMYNKKGAYTVNNNKDKLLNNMLLRVHAEFILRYFYLMIESRKLREVVINNTDKKILNHYQIKDLNTKLDDWINLAADPTKSFMDKNKLIVCFHIIGLNEYCDDCNDFSHKANKAIHANELWENNDLGSYSGFLNELKVGIFSYFKKGDSISERTSK